VMNDEIDGKRLDAIERAVWCAAFGACVIANRQLSASDFNLRKRLWWLADEAVRELRKGRP
jgi:hypothetical protein